MCDNCGCNITDANRHLLDGDGTQTIEVLENLLHENDIQAEHNRAHFDEYGVFAVNLMSGPGSGKTSLLEATIDALPAGLRVAVIEGDLETENDAERIRRHGVAAVQITTGMACHLDAHMVHDALHEIALEGIDILFIENVGNLVCPALWDLGEAGKVAILSVTEGEDKPLKYPDMFQAAGLILLHKCDLLPHLNFDVARALDFVRQVNPDAPVIQLSSTTGEGFDAWMRWIDTQCAAA